MTLAVSIMALLLMGLSGSPLAQGTSVAESRAPVSAPRPAGDLPSLVQGARIAGASPPAEDQPEPAPPDSEDQPEPEPAPPPAEEPPRPESPPAGTPPPKARDRRREPPAHGLQASRPPSLFDLDLLEAQGTILGSIQIKCVKIFDSSIPAENKAVYRFANHLHVLTRERTVRNQLTFAEGEPLVRSRLEETERNLRQLPFLQDASVEVVSVEDGRATVLVTTQDTWTTRLGARFGSSGGASSSSVRLSEVNALGRGKRIDLDFVNGVDRSTKTLGYRDPNVLGSRHRLDVKYDSSSDGRRESLVFERPFYSQEARLAYGVQASNGTERFSLYSAGQVVQHFDHEDSHGEVWIGWSRGLKNTIVRRWFSGYSYDDSSYDPTEKLAEGFDPENVPRSRTTTGPFLSYSLTKQDFIKVRYFERFSRWEDYNLGGSLSFKINLSRRGLGATNNEVIYSVTGSKGLRTGESSYVLGNAFVKGRAGGFEQGAWHFDMTHYYTGWSQQTFLLKLSADRAIHPDASDRLLLGGDSGLRGYKIRRFDGPDRFLINIEDRVHSDREFLHLLRLGAAFFLDVGNAWGGQRTIQEKVCRRNPMTNVKTCDIGDVQVDNKFGNLKADVGIAILGDVVRASGAGFVRLNIAYPIQGSKYDQGTILISFGRQGGI